MYDDFESLVVYVSFTMNYFVLNYGFQNQC